MVACPLHDDHGPLLAHIGIVHPGEMGSWVAAALREGGHDVLWASDGRSPDTRQRASATGLRDRGGVRALAADVDAVVSVCPPAAAVDVAHEVVAAGFAGIYVDANAIAPESARRIAALVETAGGTMVDGGIVGGPSDDPGETRLYLSGAEADTVASWFTTGMPEPVVVGIAVGAASAVKVGFAGWTKGSAALLLAMRAYARAEGVEGAVLDAWEHGLDGVRERSDRVASSVHRKAWRFVGEMEQLGAALADVGLPSGFHAGAAALYAALADLKDQPVPQDPEVALRRLLRAAD